MLICLVKKWKNKGHREVLTSKALKKLVESSVEIDDDDDEETEAAPTMYVTGSC